MSKKEKKSRRVRCSTCEQLRDPSSLDDQRRCSTCRKTAQNVKPISGKTEKKLIAEEMLEAAKQPLPFDNLAPHTLATKQTQDTPTTTPIGTTGDATTTAETYEESHQRAANATLAIAAGGSLADKIKQENSKPIVKQKLQPTEEQRAILEAVQQSMKNCKNNNVILVEAGAGTGKTATLRMLADVLPGNGQYTAFNAAPVNDNKIKFQGTKVACNTTHSLAFRAEGKRFAHRLNQGRVRADRLARMLDIEELVLTIGEVVDEKTKQVKSMTKRLSPGWMASQVMGAIRRFCQSADKQVDASHFRYVDGIDIPKDGQRTYENNNQLREYLLPYAEDAWKDLSDPDGQLPFTHDHYVKIWQLNKPIISANYILLDECLPGWTPVMMANGSSKHIKDIKVGERVRSYDTSTGKPKNCKVIATQKLVNQKPLVKVMVKQLHRTEGRCRNNFVVCTVDHKVWTMNRGWVESRDLQIGDITIIETAAKTTQKGKITKQGRDHLSTIHVGNHKGNGYNGSQTAENFNRIKGGNGRAMTIPQKLLLDTLGDGWEAEHVVTTYAGIGNGYPNHYKIDLANVANKIAVELDGNSHQKEEAKIVDQKKDDYLTANGWKVFRFTNRQVARNFSEVLQKICSNGTNCPTPAVVKSVEETYITEHHVYDITVADCHDFYANGILVHNCQDSAGVLLDILQQQIQTTAGHKPLLVLVGDSAQQIYEWRGAINAMSSFPNAPRLFLSQSFRFGEAIAAVANRVLETLEEPTPLRLKGLPSIPSTVGPILKPTAILCRTNALAVASLLEAIAEGRKPFLVGGGSDVIAFVEAAKNLQQLQPTSHPELACFSSWSEVQEYVKTDEDGADLKLLVKLIDGFGADTILSALRAMPSEKDADLVISTAHKSKGREWDSVRLASDFPTVSKCCDADRKLLYVAVTRAKLQLDVGDCPFFTGNDSLSIDSILSGQNKPIPTEVLPPTPSVPPAITTFTWAKSTTENAWLIRGPSGHTGETVDVERKDGSKSKKRLGSAVQEVNGVATYRVI